MPCNTASKFIVPTSLLYASVTGMNNTISSPVPLTPAYQPSLLQKTASGATDPEVIVHSCRSVFAHITHYLGPVYELRDHCLSRAINSTALQLGNQTSVDECYAAETTILVSRFSGQILMQLVLLQSRILRLFWVASLSKL